jgi:hypothetical protein
MSEIANTVPPSGGIGKLQLSDFWKGALMAFGTSLLGGIYFLLTKDHFPTWHEFQPYLQSAIAAFVFYIIKNISTNNVGKIGKPDEAVMAISKDHYDYLKDKAAQADEIPTLKQADFPGTSQDSIRK